MASRTITIWVGRLDGGVFLGRLAAAQATHPVYVQVQRRQRIFSIRYDIEVTGSDDDVASFAAAISDAQNVVRPDTDFLA